MAFQDIRHSGWYVCESDLGHSLLTTRQRDGQSPSLQKWLLAVLKRMLGVRDTTPSWCVMRECGLEPLQLIVFARQCGCTIIWLNLTATQWNRSYMLTSNWVHGLMIAGQPIFFLPWMVWPNRISSNRSCKTVSMGHWSQSFCRRPQGETLGVLDTSF